MGEVPAARVGARARLMFRRCIAWSSDLGTNEAIEDFPVGRRLAFDASKGRLWVVCGRCGQ